MRETVVETINIILFTGSLVKGISSLKTISVPHNGETIKEHSEKASSMKGAWLKRVPLYC